MRNVILVLLLLPLGTLGYAQDKADRARPVLKRPAPSAVEPTERMLTATGAIAGSILAAGLLTAILRSRKPAAVTPDDQVIDETEVTIVPQKQENEEVSVIVVATPVGAPRKAVISSSDKSDRGADYTDDLPPISSSSAPDSSKTIAITMADMEVFAHALQTARRTSVAGSRLYGKLHPLFIGVDDSGTYRTVGTVTGTWYRLDDGQWIACMPSERIFLNEALFQKLLELQTAFTPTR